MNISVLIPVYNAEKYLSRCVESILAQHIYELILVNDGSSDSSGSICDKYVQKDIRVRVFHQENKGVSAARNFALENAKGEWVAFVDADDYVEKGWIDVLTSTISIYESDIYLYGYRNVNPASIEEVSPDKLSITPKEFVESSFYNHAVWSYLFKLSLIRGNDIFFPIELKYSEDQAFLLKYIAVCQKVTMINNVLYNYCANTESALFKPLNAVRIIYNLQAANDYLQFSSDKNARVNDFAIWRLYEDFFLFYPQVKKEYGDECQKLYNTEYKRTLLYYPEFRKYLFFRFSSYNLYWMDSLRRLPQTLIDKKNYFVRKTGNLNRKIIKAFFSK